MGGGKGAGQDRGEGNQPVRMEVNKSSQGFRQCLPFHQASGQYEASSFLSEHISSSETTSSDSSTQCKP